MDAYMAHHAATLVLLARITEHLANHDDGPAEDLHWGHVGDIAETRRVLQELSDRLFSEGEHATVACLHCPATFGSSADLQAHYATAH
jgi:hypothetical protein